MMCTKHMKTILKPRFEGIKEIELIEDILRSYSHIKVDNLFSASSIKFLFELFVAHGKEEFVSNYHGVQKSKYQEAFNEIMTRFANNNDI